MGRDKEDVISIRIVDGLPFVEVTISANNKSVVLKDVLLDTGSAGSIFSADSMLDLGLIPKGEDDLYVIRGVGGTEYVFSKTVEKVTLGSVSLDNFKIEVGAMDYGFNMDGILGVDYLLKAKLNVDFNFLRVEK
jgi:Aspartyl protease